MSHPLLHVDIEHCVKSILASVPLYISMKLLSADPSPNIPIQSSEICPKDSVKIVKDNI